MNPPNTRVLIADPDRNHLNLLSLLIERQFRCQVLQAKDGIELLRAVTKEWRDLDLVILDLRVHGIDSIGALNILKRNRQLRDLAVLVCGVTAGDAELAEICRHQRVDFIDKPISLPLLSSKVEYLLSGR